jgi:hypothetical protein
VYGLFLPRTEYLDSDQKVQDPGRFLVLDEENMVIIVTHQICCFSIVHVTALVTIVL